MASVRFQGYNGGSELARAGQDTGCKVRDPGCSDRRGLRAGSKPILLPGGSSSVGERMRAGRASALLGGFACRGSRRARF